MDPTYLTPERMHHIMAWKSPSTPFHIALVSLSALRASLSATFWTTRHRDLIERPMVALLRDDHMSILAYFHNRLLSGCKVETLHFGCFTLLPKKSPHVVVGNGCPLSNLSVIWKLFSTVITKALQIWLTDHNHISCTQRAMQRSTSVVGLLRMVFGWIQHRRWHVL